MHHAGVHTVCVYDLSMPVCCCVCVQVLAVLQVLMATVGVCVSQLAGEDAEPHVKVSTHAVHTLCHTVFKKLTEDVLFDFVSTNK